MFISTQNRFKVAFLCKFDRKDKKKECKLMQFVHFLMYISEVKRKFVKYILEVTLQKDYIINCYYSLQRILKSA